MRTDTQPQTRTNEKQTKNNQEFIKYESNILFFKHKKQQDDEAKMTHQN